MYSEDNLLPISALEHLAFCERQCALIHIEQVWQENRLTTEGRILHEKVHDGEDETRGDVRIARGLRLRSLRLGLAGIADVVEFHGDLRSEISDLKSPPTPFPVEYKRGIKRHEQSFEIQLCAQALCLEEMLNCAVPAGALFYGISRRRRNVEFTPELRQTTEHAAVRLHALFDSGITPPAVYVKKCERCSLLRLCMPETVGKGKSAKRYLGQMLTTAEGI